MQRLLAGTVFAVVGTLVFLPVGTALFAVLTFLAWRWSVPTWLRIAFSCLLVVLLFLLSGAFTAGSGSSGTGPA